MLNLSGLFGILFFVQATGYEFLLAWNSVSKDDVKGYAAILEQIQPKSLPKGNCLIFTDVKNYVVTVGECDYNDDDGKDGYEDENDDDD